MTNKRALAALVLVGFLVGCVLATQQQQQQPSHKQQHEQQQEEIVVVTEDPSDTHNQQQQQEEEQHHETQQVVVDERERATSNGGGGGDGDVSCVRANDCAYVVGKPYCLNETNTCVACNPFRLFKDCDCPVRHYCISDTNDPLVGHCRQFEPEVLGRQCNSDLKDLGMSTINGENDRLFCGKVVYNQDLTAKLVEWEGSCQRGICYECSSAPLPSAPYAYCNDGRCCIDREFGYAIVGIFSWSYFFKNPFLVSFYSIAVAIVIAVIVILYGVITYTVFQMKYVALQHSRYD